jgi:septum formation protein
MNSESLPTSLILASSTKYRKLLLQRFGLPFDCHSPDIDETGQADESPSDLVARLALQKAQAISENYPYSVVIGSDQLAVFDQKVIGKPGNHQAALEQLMSFSGQTVEFLTAICVVCSENCFEEQYTDRTQVCFRDLQNDEIERYLQKEKPFDCAGAFKAESLGIVLFERISSEDPTALIGLPLIRTAAILRRAGLQLP